MASAQQSNDGPAMKKPRVSADSWSKMHDEPDTKHEHVFEIANFSEKMKMDPKKRLTSAVFSIQTKDKVTDWSILCFPNGDTVKLKDHVSIFLGIKKIPEVPLKTKCALSIMNKDGSKKVEKNFVQTFDKGGKIRNWGTANFITHAVLLNPENNLLPDDVLTIHCSIAIQNNNSVVTSGTSKPLLSPGMLDQTNTAKSLENMMGEMFLNGKFSDCTVSCQGREFNCHKNVLAARSVVFDAMFTHDMEETRRGEVVIKDLDSDTVGKMLAYVYTGKVEEIEAKAAELLAAAEKYILPELKMMSEEALCRTMKIDNVLDMLVLADLHKASSVKSVAMKFMLENARELVSQDGENLKKKLGQYPEILVEMFVAATNSDP